MSSRTSNEGASEPGRQVTLTEQNTFGFLPGPMRGVSCPRCFHDQLLVELIDGGECRACGATIDVSLTVRPEE
ncbi:MAG: hypothetical protein ABEJ23_06385 [Haloarculaceae archaeon]